MEGSSNQESKTPTPDPEINPQKAKLLINKLKDELALARAEKDPVKAKQHFQIVEKIKKVLLAYQEQQQGKQQNNENKSEKKESEIPIITSPMPEKTVNNVDSKVTLENYQQIKKRLNELSEKVKSLQSSKNDSSDKESIDKQILEAKNQLQQCYKGAVYMRNALIDQGRLTANATPVNGMESREESKRIDPKPVNINTTPQPISTPTPIQTPTQTIRKPIPQQTPMATRSQTQSLPRVASTSRISAPTIISRPIMVQSSTTNFLSTTQDPNVTPANIPDNDGRVLTKRKLNELINNLSVDQGDTKTTVENDVEELFLDLADEFVREVLEFSCKLAKHRKLDKVDVKDVQLNLERNWNMRIPGYTNDEIKAARKWSSKPEYTEKLKEISKHK
ncbi:unnamed protein product [Candida verbasci]|uniref:TBP-associated factor 12 n=1 Tax=Candida verbasci TaxID=1227364 RepID=A0A9W4XDE0_9ASCO|nr:unnamed protein product [Candida verbasci]